MQKIQNTIESLYQRLHNQFGKDSYELRLLSEIIRYINQGDLSDLTHEEEICLALADAYDH